MRKCTRECMYACERSEIMHGCKFVNIDLVTCVYEEAIVVQLGSRCLFPESFLFDGFDDLYACDPEELRNARKSYREQVEHSSRTKQTT